MPDDSGWVYHPAFPYSVRQPPQRCVTVWRGNASARDHRRSVVSCANID